MNTDVLTATALIVAAACSACLVLAVPAVGVLLLKGDLRGMFRATVSALVLAMVALGSFALVGAGATNYLAPS